MDHEHVIIMNNSNPFRPVARKVKAPVSSPLQTNDQKDMPYKLHDLSMTHASD